MATGTKKSVQELEDAFIKITFEEEEKVGGDKIVDPFYLPWHQQGEARFADAPGFGLRVLKKHYPKYKIVGFDYFNLLSYPGCDFEPLTPDSVETSLMFFSLGREMGTSVGVLVDMIKFGAFHVSWEGDQFLLYVVQYPRTYGDVTHSYLLHESSEELARQLLMAAGIYANELHNEILVFNQGFWQKDHSLWAEIQKANWDDIILKEEYKQAIKKDVFGFFKSEDLYKNLAIPWKRGLIMFGPPGNGKTITMKAIMKDADARGHAPLYVKSFQSWMGEEASMAAVFEKARQMSPCVLILEDLDSLINDRNRSFFLNQLDGFEGNDGILVIGSTNHFERLDPALSGRPSRFDRKYLFDDPDEVERTLYAEYWQAKLQPNKSVDFPDDLVKEIAQKTNKFSFAYLKEAFVSTLVLLANLEGDNKPTFATVLRGQIKELRSQLDKDPEHQLRSRSEPFSFAQNPLTRPLPSGPRTESRVAPNFKIARLRMPQQNRIWGVSAGMDAGPSQGAPGPGMPGDFPGQAGNVGQRADGSNIRNATFNLPSLGGRSFLA